MAPSTNTTSIVFYSFCDYWPLYWNITADTNKFASQCAVGSPSRVGYRYINIYFYFPEATRNEHWVGRGCCHLAQYPICRSSCALAGNQEDLHGFCRPSDEPEFFGCLERRDEGERCCSNVSNSTCRSVCRELFHNPGKQSNLQLYSSKGCFHQVPKCLKNVAETTNAENPRQCTTKNMIDQLFNDGRLLQ